jgi:hypothetical protein
LAVRAVSALIAFPVSFAASLWVLCVHAPATPDIRYEPVAPQVPTPPRIPPDLPPERLDHEDIACMNDLANCRGWPREFRAEALRHLLTNYLRPPADANRVAAVLRNPRWVAEAEVLRLKGLLRMGTPPPPGLDEEKGPVFWVRVLYDAHRPAVWWVVRVSGRPDPTASDFRAFLRGECSPLRIEESGWVEPNGGLIHYTIKGHFYCRY